QHGADGLWPSGTSRGGLQPQEARAPLLPSPVVLRGEHAGLLGGQLPSRRHPRLDDHDPVAGACLRQIARADWRGKRSSPWPGPRRFVVIRRSVPEEPSAQLHLFQMGGYSYQLLVTNLKLTPLHLWRFYSQRARAELIIRELKDAYALGKIPTKDFWANEAFFQIVLLAYNLLNW